MKDMKKIQILMLAVVMLFVFASPGFSALSTQTTSDVNLINVDKTAPGTKLTGPLTLYFGDYNSDTGNYNLYVFLRLRKGYELHSFSAIIPDVEYTASNIDYMTSLVEDFIEDSVLPELYDGATPPYAIKATDQIVQDDPLCNFCSGMYFAIMDVTIAVQD